jgi:hypothetical protein
VHEDTPGGYARHGHPAETVTLAAVAALGLEAVLPSAGAPGWVLPASEIIASCGTALVTWSATGRKLMPAFLAAFGSFLGGWTAYAQATGLWTWDVVGTLMAGTAAFIPLGVWSWHRRSRRDDPFGLPPAITAVAEPVALPPMPDENELEMRKFEMMLTDFGLGDEKSPLVVTSLTEERSGRVVHITLPLSGRVTLQNCRDQARNIEVRMRADEGAISFDRNGPSSEVIMRVRERNGLSESRTLTPELRATTVNKPFTVGFQEDDTPQLLTVREVHGMIVGTTGSGKSVVLNIMVSQLAYCPDTIIWVIDMKGGRFARPWFQAWSYDRAVAPPIDWVATTRKEAELMMSALPAIVDARSRSGIGGSKIIPSPSMPQIVLICDETAVLLGTERGGKAQIAADEKTNTWFGEQAVAVAQMGRSEAVSTWWSGQRGTQSMAGPSDLKALVDMRVALRPSSIDELQWVIPDAYFAGAQLAYLGGTPGVGVVARGKKASQIVKFLHHDHIDGVCGEQASPRCVPECPVYRTAVETAPIRPHLDRLTASAIGQPYARRWERAAEAGMIQVPQHALRAAAVSLSGGGDSAKFDEIISGLRDIERDLHPGHIRVRELLAARGVMGMPVSMMMSALEQEGIECARESVHRWLAKDREEGLLHHPGYRRWVWGPGENTPDDDD